MNITPEVIYDRVRVKKPVDDFEGFHVEITRRKEGRFVRRRVVDRKKLKRGIRVRLRSLV